MLTELNEARSIDTLSFSLELTTIWHLISAITNRGPQFVLILEEILTDFVMFRLNESQEVAERIIDQLFQWEEHLQTPDILRVADILNRIPYSKNRVDARMSESVEDHTKTFRLVLAAKAKQFDNPEEYFAELKNDDVDSLIAMEIAAYTYFTDVKLIKEFIEVFEIDKPYLIEAWNYLCKQQDVQTLISISTNIACRFCQGSISLKPARMLILYCLPLIFVHGSRVQHQDVEQFIDILPKLARVGARDLSEHIIRFLVSFFAPGVVGLDASWKIDPEFRYAVTALPLAPLKVKEILSLIRVNPRLSLSSSTELQNSSSP